MEWLTQVRWSPYATGFGIGILSWFTFLISRKPIAASTTYARTAGMIERLIRGGQAESRPYYRKIGLNVDWQWMLVLGVVLGAYLSAILSGDFQWRWVPPLWASSFGVETLPRILVALAGGIFIGFGARWAGGCTSGHGISGTLQLAISSWVSAICFFAGGVLTAQIIYRVFG